MDTILSRIATTARTQPVTLALTGALLAVSTAYIINSSKVTPPLGKKIIPSPRETLLQHLSADQIAKLPYPPDLLPGGRDVNTPYGTIRVYEWGPEDGKKIVFVHGDGTPCPVWAEIANQMAENGYRVLTFDLYGRGYSDTPMNVAHGPQLYALQILFAITSSPIPWTGESTNGFSLAGYSLGGVITLDFFRTFPSIVNSIVLFAPAGLLRSLPASYTTPWFRYPGFTSANGKRKLAATASGVKMIGPKYEFNPTQPIDLPAICQWQFDNHEGNVISFIETINSGATQNQEDIWNETCNIIKQRSQELPQSELNRKGGKLLLFTGNEDWIVPRKDVIEDLDRLLGKENYVEKTLPGGHGFVLPNSKIICETLLEFWK